jgi:hypothetical protein
MALAAVLLAPFLNTPFTIDDPLYLREAQHVLVDPLHPQAFNIVWNYEVSKPASQILPGGLFVPFLLIPTAMSGCKEWVGHLTILLFLLAALYAASRAALRLGLDQTQARWASLLTVACPAVLGMSATIMPDVPAMLLVILGMERILAWRDDREWHQGLAASAWLTLAALTRLQTIGVLAAAFVFLLDGLSAAEIRRSFQQFPQRFAPVVLTPIAFLIVSALASNPDAEGENILLTFLGMPGGVGLLIRNGLSFLAHWLLVVPLTIPWLVLRFRKISPAWQIAGLVGAGVAATRYGWVAFAAAATCVALLDIGWDALQRRDRVQLALWLWLGIAIPAVIYFHLPSKYLLPSVPAAAILVVRLRPESARAGARWLMPSVVAAGVVLGFLILAGIRDLAETQRTAVNELVVPRIQAGENVWIAGHWGFQWYGERAGAIPMTMEPPLPHAGETIVVSLIDRAFLTRKFSDREVVRHFCYPSSRFGRVMDFDARAGFFSNLYGDLPWVWGSAESSCFEVWQAR